MSLLLVQYFDRLPRSANFQTLLSLAFWSDRLSTFFCSLQAVGFTNSSITMLPLLLCLLLLFCRKELGENARPHMWFSRYQPAPGAISWASDQQTYETWMYWMSPKHGTTANAIIDLSNSTVSTILSNAKPSLVHLSVIKWLATIRWEQCPTFSCCTQMYLQTTNELLGECAFSWSPLERAIMLPFTMY